VLFVGTGRWLENVDRTHLVIASCELVQQTVFYVPAGQNKILIEPD